MASQDSLQEQKKDSNDKATPNGDLSYENTCVCQVCCLDKPRDSFITFSSCGHSFCSECVRYAFQYKVSETRVKLQCLQCSAAVTQEELERVCDGELYQKYLNACLNRYLSTTPNVRYCPAPDCPFACIDTSTLVQSDVVDQHFVCHREECGREFCNSCRQPWHEGKTCQQVREEMPAEMQRLAEENDRIEVEINKNTKECPRCHNKIEKMKDTCNMVVCWYCDLNFCWLCGREVNDWHFFSPTGCTLYGSSSWSRRSIYCCRFWMWTTAPLLLLLVSILVYPVSLVLAPIGLALLVYYGGKAVNCAKTCLVTSVVIVVLLAVLFDIILALLCAIAFYVIGVVYIYCCMPLAMVLQYSPDSRMRELEQAMV